MKFTIKTRSVFENVYVIEAPTAAEAQSLVESDYELDFLQSHKGEEVISTVMGDKKDYYKELGFV